MSRSLPVYICVDHRLSVGSQVPHPGVRQHKLTIASRQFDRFDPAVVALIWIETVSANQERRLIQLSRGVEVLTNVFVL